MGGRVGGQTSAGMADWEGECLHLMNRVAGLSEWGRRWLVGWLAWKMGVWAHTPWALVGLGRGRASAHSNPPSPFVRSCQVPLMGLIELVRGMATSDETFEASQRLAAHLGKTTCVSQVRCTIAGCYLPLAGAAVPEQCALHDAQTARTVSCACLARQSDLRTGAAVTSFRATLRLPTPTASPLVAVPRFMCAGPPWVHCQSHPPSCPWLVTRLLVQSDDAGPPRVHCQSHPHAHDQ